MWTLYPFTIRIPKDKRGGTSRPTIYNWSFGDIRKEYMISSVVHIGKESICKQNLGVVGKGRDYRGLIKVP